MKKVLNTCDVVNKVLITCDVMSKVLNTSDVNSNDVHVGFQRLRRSSGGGNDDQQRPLGHLHHRAGRTYGLSKGTIECLLFRYFEATTVCVKVRGFHNQKHRYDNFIIMFSWLA